MQIPDLVSMTVLLSWSETLRGKWFDRLCCCITDRKAADSKPAGHSARLKDLTLLQEIQLSINPVVSGKTGFFLAI